MTKIFTAHEKRSAPNAVSENSSNTQGKKMPAVPVLQQKAGDDASLLQGKFEPIQRTGRDDEQPDPSTATAQAPSTPRPTTQATTAPTQSGKQNYREAEL